MLSERYSAIRCRISGANGSVVGGSLAIPTMGNRSRFDLGTEEYLFVSLTSAGTENCASLLGHIAYCPNASLKMSAAFSPAGGCKYHLSSSVQVAGNPELWIESILACMPSARLWR